jgi:hypothetical protein
MVIIRLRTIHFRVEITGFHVEIAEKQTAARRCRYNLCPAGTIFALKGQHILACRNAAGNRTQIHNALKGQKNV